MHQLLHQCVWDANFTAYASMSVVFNVKFNDVQCVLLTHITMASLAVDEIYHPEQPLAKGYEANPNWHGSIGTEPQAAACRWPSPPVQAHGLHKPHHNPVVMVRTCSKDMAHILRICVCTVLC